MAIRGTCQKVYFAAMRMSSVQTDEQLVYVVRCLVAYAEVCGIFTVKSELQEVFPNFVYLEKCRIEGAQIFKFFIFMRFY